MTTREQKLVSRMYELFRENEDWGLKKALAAAVAEQNRKRAKKKAEVRQIGWLEYT